jgi:hypothetical protein
MNILKGRLHGAVRAVVYGTEGIGKSTLATKLPSPLVLDTEDGTKQLDVDRVLCHDWRAVEHAVKELAQDSHGYKTIVIDTADWLEKSLIDHMLRTGGKKSIEDYGYGKGYTMLQEHVSRFLAECDKLVATGLHIVFVAHAKVSRVSPPDQTDGYDRYELKLTKQVAPLIKEWADLVLFCNYRLQMVEGSDGRIKATGGKERVMHAERSAAWDAKNRYGLPAEMAMDAALILPIFGQPSTAKTEAKAPITIKKAQPAPAHEPEPEQEAPSHAFATNEQIDEIGKLVKQAGSAGSRIAEKALADNEAIEFAELPSEQAGILIAALSKLQPKGQASCHVPAHIVTWLEANEETVNAYLASIKYIQAGQTWRELSQENADSIATRHERFARAAKINPITKAAA